MKRTDNKLWLAASDLAVGIMGKSEAEYDPEAYWCLVELLVKFARQR